jgi:hypothetical protein
MAPLRVVGPVARTDIDPDARGRRAPGSGDLRGFRESGDPLDSLIGASGDRPQVFDEESHDMRLVTRRIEG